ncbi:hypothetical protein AB0F91_46345 [Amycolatopsis sp. NPDC023774]|uniref:hypothetical protein n=1 Tax=Actinomycetes TaxID=1760 RepID=UPI0033C8224C
MWRIGFYVWRTWLWVKLAAPALLVLFLIYLAQGASALFWSALVVFGCIALGVGIALTAFRNQEFGPVGRERVR